MPPQNTHSPALREVLDHWRDLAKSPDPIVRRAARELVADLTAISQPRVAPEDRSPAYWCQVISEVIADEPRYSVTVSGYKTGHGYAHASKSGTCVSVNTRLGLWYCSSPGCRRGGDTAAWVAELEQCSYGQAWNLLAERFGARRANTDPD